MIRKQLLHPRLGLLFSNRFEMLSKHLGVEFFLRKLPWLRRCFFSRRSTYHLPDHNAYHKQNKQMPNGHSIPPSLQTHISSCNSMCNNKLL